MAVISLRNVSVAREGNQILSNIDWTVEANQRWVIIGPNGAGKTTLLRIVATQIHPSTGDAQVLGKDFGHYDLSELRPRIGFASTALASRIPLMETVLDTVMTASHGVIGRWTEQYDTIDERRALRVLTEWDLGDFADRTYGSLSDGEKKRTQIARAVMPDPELLLLDEPVASLDLAAREQTVSLIGEYAASPYSPAMVMVTHHLEEIPAGFTHAMILADGGVFAAGEIGHVLTSENISEAFGLGIDIDMVNGRYRATARRH
ncbi:MAG: ABC transporter ATP-binding protein [Actinomycetales bacterium]|nr:ABC transporter ATP-binding protein [Actinomycetales bacterium]